jgi:hypothetical protein
MGSVIVIYLDRIVTLRRISMRTGVPIRQLQNWRTIAMLLAFAAVAAALAWGTVASFFPASGLLTRLLAGATTLASAYVALAVWSGLGRIWLDTVRSSRTGT